MANLIVNGVEPKNISFNGSDVKKLIWNGKEVWRKKIYPTAKTFNINFGKNLHRYQITIVSYNQYGDEIKTEGTISANKTSSTINKFSFTASAFKVVINGPGGGVCVGNIGIGIGNYNIYYGMYTNNLFFYEESIYYMEAIPKSLGYDSSKISKVTFTQDVSRIKGSDWTIANDPLGSSTFHYVASGLTKYYPEGDTITCTSATSDQYVNLIKPSAWTASNGTSKTLNVGYNFKYQVPSPTVDLVRGFYDDIVGDYEWGVTITVPAHYVLGSKFNCIIKYYENGSSTSKTWNLGTISGTKTYTKDLRTDGLKIVVTLTSPNGSSSSPVTKVYNWRAEETTTTTTTYSLNNVNAVETDGDFILYDESENSNNSE